MRPMTFSKVACIVIATFAAAVPLYAQQAEQKINPAAVPVQQKPIVQIAILLDTSSSMDGLIEQAKAQLWKVVNEFAKAQRGGLRPDIQVALYHYGTPSLGRENNFIKQLTPLTDDLDKVSEELFKLTTNGGDEFCGAVIQKAAQDLKWSDDKSAYKAIFIAGNEPFTQGGIDFHVACKEAITKGIIVNTIFCGNDAAGVQTGWKDGATLADGTYMSINQNAAVARIVAPQDKEIAELGGKINSTYVTYGIAGGRGAANQMAQDGNAMRAGRGGGGGGRGAPAAAAVERSITKAGSSYVNGAWDLVDAINAKKVELKDVKDEDLPEEMRKLDAKGREDYLARKTRERADIQVKIQQLAADREKFLAEKRKEQSDDKTLDTAIINAVRTQARSSGMIFPESPKQSGEK